jgi:Fic family protein
MHEATNLSLAIQRIVHTQEDISIQYIHDIHAMILRNIDDENAGIYRKIQVYISGDTRTLPPARDVDMQMSALIDWYIQHRDILHPVILSGQFHYRFVQIHPYIDGNGRTARMLSNIILLSRGYPIVILPVVRRGDYIQSLHSMTGSLDIFTQWYADIVHENLKDYIRMITP